MRLVFCGTPQFAIPTLEQLIGAGHTIELVVTQPDRVRGRDQAPSPPPVKVLAEAAGLPVVQPEKIKNNAELRSRLEAIRPDAIIVVAYGRIIPDWMLQLPRWGNLNLHASLLPKYRGAAPIQWAVANGETTTGATTMRLDHEVCSTLRQQGEKLLRCLIRRNRQLALQENIARVEARVEAHGRCAGQAFPIRHRPLNRSGPAVFGKQ